MAEQRSIGKELIPDAKEARKILSDALSESNSLVDSLREALGINIQRSTNDSNLLSINKRINNAIQAQATAFDSIDAYQKQIQKNTRLISEGRAVNENLAKGLNSESKEEADAAIKAVQQRQEVTREIEKQITLISQGDIVDKKELELAEQRLETLREEERRIDSKIDASFDQLGVIQSQYAASVLNTKELEKQNNLLEESEDSLSGATFLSDFLSKIPGLGDISKKAIGDVTTKLTEMNASGEQLPSSLETSGMFLKNISKQVGVATKGFLTATAPLAVFNELGQAILQANQEVVELQRGLGLTVEEATELRQEMIGVAAATGDVNVTATKLLQTFSALNKQFGFITNFSNEILATSTQLTEVIGVSEESAGNLAALTALRGGNLENNLETLLDTSRTLQEQRGVQLDTKEILDAVGRVTGEIRANLAANPNAIAEALTLAKQFGGELEDIAASADALLQFESSIAAELKAENLIARELNLNRARSAALQGDLATVAKELTEQAGDYNEFLQMNVIERRALADAVGLEANKLEEILFSQAIQTKSAQELLDIGGADLLQRAKQQSLQEKLNATVDKLKATFVDLGTALVPALDVITKMVAGVGQLVRFLEPVIGTLTGIAAGAAAGSLFGPLGTAVGAVLGGAVGAVGDVQRIEDGIVDPDGNVIKTPKGTIQLDSEDSLIAGTNLFGETKIPQPNPNRILPPSQMAQQSDYDSVMEDVKLPVQDVAPIATQQPMTQMSDYTVKLETESKKQLEEIKGLRKDIKENTKAVLASGNMVAKTKTKLTVGATDFGTDLNVFSSEIQ